MRGLWLLLISTACGAVVPAPIELGLSPRSCWPYSEGHVYAGYPIVRDAYWYCHKYYEGFSESDPTLCDRSIVNVQTRCDGVPCADPTVEPLKHSANQGARRVIVTPQAPGPLRIEYAFAHGNGAVDVTSFSCRVEPRPAVSLACTIREPATGAFVPCPTPIPAGAEVHANARVAVRHPGSVAIELYEGTQRVDITCANPEYDEHGVRRACTWTAKAGTYTLRADDGNLEESQALVIAGGPAAP